MLNTTETKLKFIYGLEIFWLLLLLTYPTIAYLSHQHVDSFNSDLLTFFRFFNDIFLEQGHYKDWMLYPAPHFFPDMFVFFPFFFLAKTIYFQFLIVIGLMIILYYLSIRIIYNQFFTKQPTIFALAATTSLFLLAVKGKSPYNLTLYPAVHTSEVVAGLFLLGIHFFLIEYNKLDYKSYFLCAVSAVIAFASGLSDLLFFLQFAAPIFLAYSFLVVFKKIKLRLGLFFSLPVIVCTSLGEFLANKFLVPKNILLEYLGHPSIFKISIKTIGIQCFRLLQILKSINNYKIEIILALFYFLIITLLIISLLNTFKEKNKFNIDKKIVFFCVFILTSILVNVVSIFSFGNADYHVFERYFITFYYAPFLFFFLPLSCFKHHFFVNKMMLGLSFVVFFYFLMSMYSLFHKPGFKLHMSYYPEEIRCIDKALKGYGHYGIAQYWDANVFTSLSKEHLQFVPFNSDLTPFYWSINVKKFENPISFIVFGNGKNVIEYARSLNKETIYAKYGTPKKEVTCYTKKVFIYPKNSIKILPLSSKH